MRHALAEVLVVALPLMISTGMFSLVLFADRTLLLWYEPTQMGAAMAAGNLFWVVTCPLVGVVSMTGAIISQYVGAGQPRRVGRLIWQSVWITLVSLPVFLVFGINAERWFELTDQPMELRALEAAYFRMLMWGAAGEVLQTALSGFFSGTHRTRTIMLVSVASGLLNLVLDVVLIFGVDPAWLVGSIGSGDLSDRWCRWGIVGAGLASTLSFWFKAIIYAVLLSRPRWRAVYGFVLGARPHRKTMTRLVYFGIPAGLMYLTESAGFTAIVLQIGKLGDVPLQATTMAINFNMIAFIPLVGLSIASSVLVGQHLIADGPARAVKSVVAALMVAWAYSAVWAVAYLLAADGLMAFYALSPTIAQSHTAMLIAEGLLKFVALYVLLDATQLVIAGALRGAGDTWFVLLAGVVVSVAAVTLGGVGQSWVQDGQTWLVLRPVDGVALRTQSLLNWWWWMITLWVLSLAATMSARFLHGRWKSMRMV